MTRRWCGSLVQWVDSNFEPAQTSRSPQYLQPDVHSPPTSSNVNIFKRRLQHRILLA